MALIIEDGSIIDGANCFVSVADCDTWQAIRGSTTWPLGNTSLAEKESAIIKATDYLNGFGWKGTRHPGGQLITWPRIGAIDADGFAIGEYIIPKAVIAANCYLAGVIFDGKNVQPILERGGRISSESVDTLSTSFFEDAANRDVHSVLADLLRGLASEFDDFAGNAVTGFRITTGRIVTA